MGRPLTPHRRPTPPTVHARMQPPIPALTQVADSVAARVLRERVEVQASYRAVPVLIAMLILTSFLLCRL